MMILHDWRHIASAWIIVLALIFGPTIGLTALKAFPQLNNWQGITGPRHNGAFVNHTSPADGDVERASRR